MKHPFNTNPDLSLFKVCPETTLKSVIASSKHGMDLCSFLLVNNTHGSSTYK